MAPMKAISPLILALGPALVAPAPLAAGPAAFEEDTDGDGRPDRVVLENEFLRLVFTADGLAGSSSAGQGGLVRRERGQ